MNLHLTGAALAAITSFHITVTAVVIYIVAVVALAWWRRDN